MGAPARTGTGDGPPPPQPAALTLVGPWLLVAAFLLLMVFLLLLALDGNSRLPSLNFVLPALVSALLGVVTNPQALPRAWVWALLAGTSLVVGVVAGIAALVYPTHVGALPALISSVAALGGLFVDTTSNTHPTSGS